MVPPVDMVTGSFSYTGQYITRRLLAAGRQVRTLTGHPQPGHPLAGRVKTFPYDFEHPDRLEESLRGVDTLYNTYWVRFPHGHLNYDVAVRNLLVLIQAAARAGVNKLVHVSIMNPSEDSPYGYFRGKARVERAIRESGLRQTILRPTLVFGPEDILINNIAWMLRTWPIFLLPGSGDYLVQPVFVEDLADLAVTAGSASESGVQDAAGPEIFTYREMVERIMRAVGRKVPLLGAPAPVTYGLAVVLGWFLGDVVLTYEELRALQSGVLYSLQAPAGTTRLSQWLEAYGDRLGQEYRSELRRHFLQTRNSHA